MSSAAQHRLRRARPAGQLALALDVPDPGTPAPDGVADFAVIAAAVRPLYEPADDPWTDSPYRWVKDLPPARRSKAAVALVERWLRAAGLDPLPARGAGTPTGQLTCGEHTLDVKLSTLWASGGYTFQGVTASAADLLALLALAPDSATLWLAPTALVRANVDRGKPGWITVNRTAVPDWLAAHEADPGTAATLLGGH